MKILNKHLIDKLAVRKKFIVATTITESAYYEVEAADEDTAYDYWVEDCQAYDRHYTSNIYEEVEEIHAYYEE